MVSDGTTFVREILPLPDAGATDGGGTDGGMSMDAGVMTDAARDGGTGTAEGCHCRVRAGSTGKRGDLRLGVFAIVALVGARARRRARRSRHEQGK
jgi:hypothetical protein